MEYVSPPPEWDANVTNVALCDSRRQATSVTNTEILSSINDTQQNFSCSINEKVRRSVGGLPPHHKTKLPDNQTARLDSMWNGFQVTCSSHEPLT